MNKQITIEITPETEAKLTEILGKLDRVKYGKMPDTIKELAEIFTEDHCSRFVLSYIEGAIIPDYYERRS